MTGASGTRLAIVTHSRHTPVTASLSNSVTDEVHRLCKPMAATLSAAGVAPSSEDFAEEAGMDSEPNEDELKAFLRPPFATDGATVWDQPMVLARGQA